MSWGVAKATLLCKSMSERPRGEQKVLGKFTRAGKIHPWCTEHTKKHVLEVLSIFSLTNHEAVRRHQVHFSAPWVISSCCPHQQKAFNPPPSAPARLGGGVKQHLYKTTLKHEQEHGNKAEICFVSYHKSRCQLQSLSYIQE